MQTGAILQNANVKRSQAEFCDVASRILRTGQNSRGQNAHRILNCARVVGAGSRKERQPGLATGQCRASSRVTSHMESATLIGGSTPGREPTYYGPHVCTQGSRLWAKEMGAPGPKRPQKRARTDTQSSQTHRTPTRRST